MKATFTVNISPPVDCTEKELKEWVERETNTRDFIQGSPLNDYAIDWEKLKVDPSEIKIVT